jgi:hypothetical protein
MPKSPKKQTKATKAKTTTKPATVDKPKKTSTLRFPGHTW